MIKDYYQKSKYQKISASRREPIIRLLGSGLKGQLLDVGCGNGELALIIKQRTGLEAYGVEWSPEAVGEASERLSKVFPLNLESNLEDWPQELISQKFNYFLISEVLEHLFYPERLLVNLKTISLPDSEIIITVPNFLFWRNRLKMLLGYFAYTDSGLLDRGHIHFFTWEGLKKLVEEAGYKIVSTAHNVPTRGTKFWAKFWPGLFAYQFIIKIKRNEN